MRHGLDIPRSNGVTIRRGLGDHISAARSALFCTIVDHKLPAHDTAAFSSKYEHADILATACGKSYDVTYSAIRILRGSRPGRNYAACKHAKCE